MSDKTDKYGVKQEFFGNEGKETADFKDWWNGADHEYHLNIIPMVKELEESQTTMRGLHYTYAKLFSNLDILGYSSLNAPTRRLNTSKQINKPKINIIKSVVDTVTSGIAKNKPRPQFLTDNGDYKQQERAKKLGQYIEGVFYDSKAYDIGQKAFVDACVFGTGVVKVFEEEGKIKLERVFPDEILVDNYDGLYGTPRQMHQTQYMDRSVLCEMFPEYKNHIEAAPNGLSATAQSSSNVDMVKVVESWHLRSGKDSDDGVHCITIDNCTLYASRYDKDYFPFVFLRYSDRLAGFFGQGVVEQIVGIQLEINKTLQSIQRAQHLMSVPRVLVDSTGQTPTSQISNEIGSLIKYSGAKPEFFTPQAMTPEVYNHLKWLISSAYEVVGVSQLSATSKKPSGIDSGVALREYNDIEAERFAILGQKYETFFLDLAGVVVDISRDIYEESSDLKVNVKGKDFIKTISWKEVDIEDDKFIMQLYPSNMLPKTPAGRLQTIQEMTQAGFIDKDTALELLDFPDLKGAMNLVNSSVQLVKKQLDDIIESGEYSAPEPMLNLEQALQLSQHRYMSLRQQNADEETLELLLRYQDDVTRLMQVGMGQEQIMEPQVGMEDPLAQPEELPESDMIPYTE